MARQPRIDLGGYVYHVINRANARMQIFHSDKDYLESEKLIEEMKDTYRTRILAYVVMPNHWHFLLHPQRDGDTGKALQWLGTIHVRRHHVRNRTIGGGHIYQGRYKSFLVQDDTHLLTVLKYIERNPVRAGLVERTEDWRWGSAYRRVHGNKSNISLLAELPIDLPSDYKEWVNEPEPVEELKVLRNSVNTGAVFGDPTVSRNITQQI